MPRRTPKPKLDPPPHELTKDIGQYIVYGNGRVWSKRGSKFIKPMLINDYCYVRYGSIRKSLHRLIAETFIVNPDNLPQVDHINNDKLDNRVENLQWITLEDNIRKAYRDNLIPKHKLGVKGEHNHQSKLTNEEARRIKYELSRLSDTEVAKMFNVSQSTISRIRNSKAWTHI